MVTLEAGTLFAGRYEVIRQLGAGGMGAVYLACDPNERTFQVAIKVLYPGTLQSTKSRERFRNEITASYRIKHRNVVRAYEYFDAEDVQAYAMEYIDGGDLLEQLRAGRMACSEAVLILTQIASALEAIHKAGIVHRDLKPENILITKQGEVKITDFGVARLRESRTLTNAGSMVGTPKYLAPEYVETGECDGRGDIFAIGVIAYELLSGTSPFGKDFKPQQVLDRLKMRIPPLQEVAPGCPAQLAAIVHMAMSLKVRERYQNATALREDLERLQAGIAPIAAQHLAPAHEPKPQPESPPYQRWNTSAEVAAEPEAAPMPDGFFAASQPHLTPPQTASRAIPVLVATFAFCFSLSALGFASLVFLRTSNPLRGLQQGVFTGAIGPTKSSPERIPVGVWSFKDHALLIVGKRGCTADLITARGEYRCGDDTYRFSVGPATATGASGFVSINNLPARPWLVQIGSEQSTSAKKERPNSTTQHALPSSAIIPSNTDRAAAPTKAAPRPAPQNLDHISTIEAQLRSGELSPEDAAQLLLKEYRKQESEDKS